MSEYADRSAGHQEHTDESAVDAIAGLLSSTDEDRPTREPKKSPTPASERPAKSERTSAPRTIEVEEEPEEPLEDDDETTEPEDDDTDEDGETEQPDLDEEEDDEESEEDDEDLPKRIRFKAGEEELEVTLDELKEGYLRTSDYTRKTQALADERKQFHSTEVTQVRAERQHLATLLGQLTEAVESFAIVEPNWEVIQRDRPEDLAKEMLEWQQQQKDLQELQRRRDAAYQQAMEDQQASFRETVQAEREKLLRALPGWGDPAVSKREKAEMVKYASESLGFSEAELSSIVDHRALVVLRKAMLYDRGETDRQKAKKVVREKIEQAKKVARPGAPSRNKTRMPDVVKAKLKAQRSGREDDALDAVSLLLGG